MPKFVCTRLVTGGLMRSGGVCSANAEAELMSSASAIRVVFITGENAIQMPEKNRDDGAAVLALHILATR